MHTGERWGLLSCSLILPFIHTAHVHTDIPMESIDHNLTVTANGMHTYDSLDQMERRSTLTVSITNELYSGSRNRTNGTAAVNGNGHGHQGNVPSVAIYEQPVFSQSQYESTFNVSKMFVHNYVLAINYPPPIKSPYIPQI